MVNRAEAAWPPRPPRGRRQFAAERRIGLAEFISAKQKSGTGAPQKRRFCGEAIEAMKRVIPEEQGKDAW